MSVRIALIGYGRMGREIDAISEAHDCRVVSRLDVGDTVNRTTVGDAEVVIDFSIASAVVENLPRVASLGVNVVIGTTGWDADEEAMRKMVTDRGIGVVAAANFSLGVNIFMGIVERAATLLAPHDDFGAFLHETHHAAKIDAPSGTAIALTTAMRRAGYDAPVDVASNRVGSVPGTHAVGFDGLYETITLTHITRSRTTFARGALAAARWVRGKNGWFTMRDVVALDDAPAGG
jgi:4-hydroxy-tetrahydrodipicolinate reductase